MKMLNGLPYKPEIGACDHCGACCSISPCLLGGVRDVKRLAKYLGHSVKRYARLHLQVIPVDGVFKVSPKRKEDGSCAYHVDDGCQVHEIKPAGGKDFKCWSDDISRKDFLWNDSDLRKIGVRL